MLVKKYGNRRLYDTDASRYITLEELADAIRRGADPRVVDAKTQEDLTQSTLAQIIVEGRGAARLLPVPLLLQLVRLGDDALAEFFGRYMTFALEMYLQAKQGAAALGALNPFLGGGLGGGLSNSLGALGRLVPPVGLFGGQGYAPPPTAPVTAAAAPPSDDVAALRRELEALKREVHRPKRAKKA